MLNQDLLKELNKILKEDYGINLQQKESAKVASAWIKYFEILTNNYQGDENEKTNTN
ncbi:MAG: hypothetical protein WC928_04175 [Patescibacteria group bacterium]|jgi:hypothetical protein